MDERLAPYCEAIRAAAEAGQALRITGAGTKEFLCADPGGRVLDMRPLSGIIDYEPTELVVTARAGTPLSEIDRELRSHAQIFAFEPPRFGGDPTAGGMVAAGLSGPRRASAGALRDYVLGVTVIDGSARVMHFGGRVMKNVAGFDVSRLIAGSFGILGVIAAVSLRVVPRPETDLTLAFELDAATAIGSFGRWCRLPLPVSGSAWYQGRAFLRLSGASAAVQAARRSLGGTELDAATADAFWASIRDHDHPFLKPRSALWRLSVPATAPMLDLPGEQLVEWGGALRWLRSEASATVIADAVRQVGGSAALWHGSDGIAPRPSLDPASLAIHRRLKQAFDPRGILNPGRLIPGL